MRRRQWNEGPYYAPGPAPSAYDGAFAPQRPAQAPNLMPFDDSAKRKQRSGASGRGIVRAFLSVNPWTYVSVLCVLSLYTLYWGRSHMVTKRGVRRQREALREDARACGARLSTIENDMFVKNKEYESVVRELDSLKKDHEVRLHELYQVKGEAEALRTETESLKKSAEASTMNKASDVHAEEAKKLRAALKEAKFEIETLRHHKVGLELDLQRVKHEASFTREHIKEEVLKEDIEAIEKLIEVDIKADEAREAAGDGVEMEMDIQYPKQDARSADIDIDIGEKTSAHSTDMEKTQYDHARKIMHEAHPAHPAH